MSKFSDYLASQITPQMTLLEKFNLMIKFLQENNYISIFYSKENYNIQTESYQKEKVNLNGFTLHIGDCIVFSNGYYAFVETIGVNNFTIGNVLYFQGQQGVSVVGATITSGHLILTLSDGENIDAGNLKGISNFSINDSQHLIVNYQDGTSQDLGAIFNGNISINGNISSTGTIFAPIIDGTSVTGNSIIEKMQGYDYTPVNENLQEIAYAGVCKNGNKITFVIAASITPDATFISNGGGNIAGFGVPHAIFEKLYPFYDSSITVSFKNLLMVVSQNEMVTSITRAQKSQYTDTLQIVLLSNNLVADKKYYFRYEETFLLSDNLAN